LKDVGGRAVSEDRRRACVRHIWLVLEDAKRETAQLADVEAVEAGEQPRWAQIAAPTRRRLSRRRDHRRYTSAGVPGSLVGGV
jgi:hypothetical protein